MTEDSAGESAITSIVVHLNAVDYQIFEKYRGELSPDAFMSALLRMIDSGAVREKPAWVQHGEEPAKD